MGHKLVGGGGSHRFVEGSVSDPPLVPHSWPRLCLFRRQLTWTPDIRHAMVRHPTLPRRTTARTVAQTAAHQAMQCTVGPAAFCGCGAVLYIAQKKRQRVAASLGRGPAGRFPSHLGRAIQPVDANREVCTFPAWDPGPDAERWRERWRAARGGSRAHAGLAAKTKPTSRHINGSPTRWRQLGPVCCGGARARGSSVPVRTPLAAKKSG